MMSSRILSTQKDTKDTNTSQNGFFDPKSWTSGKGKCDSQIIPRADYRIYILCPMTFAPFSEPRWFLISYYNQNIRTSLFMWLITWMNYPQIMSIMLDDPRPFFRTHAMISQLPVGFIWLINIPWIYILVSIRSGSTGVCLKEKTILKTDFLRGASAGGSWDQEFLGIPRIPRNSLGIPSGHLEHLQKIGNLLIKCPMYEFPMYTLMCSFKCC